MLSTLNYSIFPLESPNNLTCNLMRMLSYAYLLSPIDYDVPYKHLDENFSDSHGPYFKACFRIKLQFLRCQKHELLS